jgi:predicted PurR-regulated permease PerM
MQYIKQTLESHPAPPAWFHDFPFLSDKLDSLWTKYVSNPQNLTESLKEYLPHISNATAITGAILSPVLAFFFTLMCLFYAFRDGEAMMRQIHDFGENRFDNWHGLIKKIPVVVRGVIDSIIYLGVGMGLIMGAIYYFAGLPVPVFLGVLSAVATLVPFALTIVLVLVFAIAAVKGMLVTGVVIFIVGNVINLMSDSWLRPIVIGRSVHIHFVAVLFGALGGVEVFGIIGIFLGPVFMVLLGVLWENAILKNIKPKSSQMVADQKD